MVTVLRSRSLDNSQQGGLLIFAFIHRHIVRYIGQSLPHIMERLPRTGAEADCIVMELLAGGAACPFNPGLKAPAECPGCKVLVWRGIILPEP